MIYADEAFYKNEYLGTHNSENLNRILKTASQHIDTLTFNRIVGMGFDNLTPFQQSVVREVCCQMADFMIENKDLIETTVSSYSINGVSMAFGDNWNVVTSQGIALSRSTFELLKQSGLTRRVI
ncbi:MULTISPECIES: hypothetical protein [unclassified Granulicatella]|uniref:hypothetical protein n=1 Tax=unclassified Granulicatella TaxID=2630493 RepID=UPI00066E19FA|nr:MULTISPECIES: hypothetical protein [unclassified Granulicatella]